MLLKLLAMKDAYLTREDGATAIEYGLIAGGIAVAIVAMVFLVGDDLEALFTQIQGKTAEGAARG